MRTSRRLRYSRLPNGVQVCQEPCGNVTRPHPESPSKRWWRSLMADWRLLVLFQYRIYGLRAGFRGRRPGPASPQAPFPSFLPARRFPVHTAIPPAPETRLDGECVFENTMGKPAQLGEQVLSYRPTRDDCLLGALRARHRRWRSSNANGCRNGAFAASAEPLRPQEIGLTARCSSLFRPLFRDHLASHYYRRVRATGISPWIVIASITCFGDTDLTHANSYGVCRHCATL